MGYSTSFKGAFQLDRQLACEHAEELFELHERSRGGPGPEGQPDAYCQWQPTRLLDGIEWDGGEKFYMWEEWLRWIVERRLIPWSYTLTGAVRWSGEEAGDTGTLSVVDGRVVASRDVNLGDPALFAEAILAVLDAKPDDRRAAVLGVIEQVTRQGHFSPHRCRR